MKLDGSPKRTKAGLLAVGVLPTALFLVFVGLPLFALVVRGLGYDGFWPEFTGETLRTALKLSLVTSLVSLATTVVVGTPMAYFLARKRFRGRGLIDAAIEFKWIGS